MKKSSFLEGAFIATFGIIICKIIGLLYVIPFYSIIGEKGGALYSYAYSIYAVFLSLSTSGIPIAISKLVSEYQTLEYYNTKERVYKIGLIFISILGFILFITMILSADTLAALILGDMQGGNSQESVAMVIRIVSISLLIVPILSVTKGYLQGHKIIDSTSKANVLEQTVRVIVIILGSLLAVKVLNLKIDTAVGIAVFGASVGAISSYFYLLFKINKNKEILNKGARITRNEAKITTKVIVKKIFIYALPFIVIDLLKSAYSMVDTFTVVKTLTKLDYSASVVENVIGVLTTWGTKLNMIVIALALGISISLVPSITSYFIKKDMINVNKKIEEALQVLSFFCLPMAAGLSFIAVPLWNIFYGFNIIGSSIFSLSIFMTVTFSLLTILLNITQTLNCTKISIGTLFASFLMKAIFNVPAMYIASYFKIDAYYGPVIATLLSHLFAIIFLIYMLNKNFKIDFKKCFNTVIKIILCTLIMIMSLKIVDLFIPVYETNRLISIFKVLFYCILGGLIYFIVAYQSKTFQTIFKKLKK